MNSATSSLRALGALSAGLLALGMLAACTPEPEPKPTKTALFSSDEEAFKAAEETYRAYTDAYNALDTTDPASFEVIDPYVTGRYAASEREALSELYAEKLARSGASKTTAFTGQSYSPPDRITARICSDISATDILDASGKSVVSPDRPERYALDVEFEIEGDFVRISDSQAVEDEICTSPGS